ncbi:DUF4149 domain-containing protein [Helicobacter saguini]|uniref:DUF4149 domain-containing protein n=1 Tax=Helicobacter saguini TaxID=1548018 RepID=A0A347VT34_9HELI|nr:DUF4149 domain-containing protein [Helicobacter saguini]MWV62256.1 DUF4149 domain-containing protein [Helicobacter saguini]MWV67071.1 DUF4149 domain-containing protein [Helicobacter saguini]MWV69421.1 DUF4149 domain-containing protein [Helicobacter saguini]MWV71025.1 DUF4149 domain-containing protein [Helicobacter saguini]TLD95069.1 DUF4149 domain-containing protein [Helicobacter saguini]
MNKFFRVTEPLYLLFLGIGVGAIIACGAFAAPVVFNMSKILGMDSIGTYEGGIVMGQIFVRLGGYLQFLLIIICIYEIVSFLLLRKNEKYSIFWLILGIVSVVCIALFVWYYMPFLLNSENLSDKEHFDKLHTQSRHVSQILMCSLSVLFVWRIYKKML